MSTSAEHAFLQAVLEDPDNDLPRLAYADWLDEQGDPRGELIRVQCELFPLTEEDERFRPLYKREQTLLKRYKDEWLGPLKELTQHPKFYRGFVENIVLGSNQFLERRKEIYSLAPIRMLNIMALATKHVSPLRSAQEWSGLRELSLDIRKMTDIGWRKLITAPQLESLQKLRLNWWGMEPHHFDMLAEMSARNIHEIEFAHRVWRNQWNWGVLFRSGVLSSLKSFVINVNDLEHDFINSLLSKSRFPNLQRLALNSLGYFERVSRKRLQLLGSHSRLPELRSLAFAIPGVESNQSIPRLLFPNPAIMQTEQLQVQGCSIDDDGADRIAQFASLKTLRLDNCQVGDSGVSIFADSERMQNLRVLSLIHNNLTDAAAEAIAKSPYLNNLLVLDLSRNDISKDTQKALRKHFGVGVCKFSRP